MNRIELRQPFSYQIELKPPSNRKDTTRHRFSTSFQFEHSSWHWIGRTTLRNAVAAISLLHWSKVCFFLMPEFHLFFISVLCTFVVTSDRSRLVRMMRLLSHSASSIGSLFLSLTPNLSISVLIRLSRHWIDRDTLRESDCCGALFFVSNVSLMLLFLSKLISFLC